MTSASIERKLTTILSADVQGFSRLMGEDEEATLHTLHASREVTDTLIQHHRGRIVGTAGDSVLAEFASVVDAVRCAIEIQQALKARNAALPVHRRMEFRIGINLGDVMVDGEQIYGDGVNIAARLQALADAGGVCISGTVYDQVKNKLALHYEDLGEQVVKNIAEPVRMWRVVLEVPSPPVEQASSLRAGWMAAPPEGQGEGASREATSLKFKVQSSKSKEPRRVGRGVFVLVGVLLLGGIVTVRYFFLPTPNPQHPAPNTQAAPAALPLPDKPSIVVLPFVNISQDPGQDYFSDGLTEVLTSDLSKISSLFVIARNSAFTYKGKAVKVQDVGREMGVRYVLEGSVLKAGDQVRITAQLIDASTGYHLWSERYDRPLQDILRLQDEVVRKIVTTLGLQLSVQKQGYIIRKHTDNLEAYDFFLRGVDSFYRVTKEANTQARQMFEKAVALDLQYAEAYAWLSHTYFEEWIFRWSADPQNVERALALAQQALALDDSLPRAHSVLSLVYAEKHQYDQAIAEGERATALDPNNADSYRMRAGMLNFAGRPEDALQMLEQAMRLNPHYPPMYLWTLGWAYSLTGRYTEAIATLREFISRSPNHQVGHLYLALSYVQQWASQQTADSQTLAQALAAAQRVLALNDAYFGGHLVLGYVYLWQKQYEPALAERERAIALDPNLASNYAGLAEVLSHMGRSEEAVRMAEQALRLKPQVADDHLDKIGDAYDLAGRPEEALAPLKQYLSHYPNILGAHLTLAAVYSELGKEAEARAEAVEVLRINPQFSLEVHKQRVPIKDPAMLERHLAALRKAGLK